MSTTAVEVGQIRQNPADDTFIVVRGASWPLSGRVGWTVRPTSRLGRRIGPDRWISDLTLTTWALMPADAITEPQ
jgi:hypothetical protein